MILAQLLLVVISASSSPSAAAVSPSTPPAATPPAGNAAHVPSSNDVDHQAPLSKSAAATVARELGDARVERLRRERAAEMEAKVVEVSGARMPYATTVFGEAPERGRSLWISLHGGGGAPAGVNDSQWENQKRLYRLSEGIYLAPRAPFNAWNMWHQPPIDALFDRVIENFIAFEGVDPDRVYVLGYSAGGDGVFQLGPRMADRWAAAAMMAGHPGDARPDGLRNIGFALHTGANDSAYDRNSHAVKWGEALDELERKDPGGYVHQVEVHEGKGHWMDGADRVAIPWMAGFTRDLRASKIVWVQDDVTHRRFAWLAVDAPVAGARIVVAREGQRITIREAPPSTALRIRLDDEMLDLDAEVVVSQGGVELFRGMVPRRREVLERTLEERGDPRGVFSAEVVVTTGEESAAPTGPSAGADS